MCADGLAIPPGKDNVRADVFGFVPYKQAYPSRLMRVVMSILKKTDNVQRKINRCDENESTQRGIHVSWNVLCSALKRKIDEDFLYVHPCVIFQTRLPPGITYIMLAYVVGGVIYC